MPPVLAGFEAIDQGRRVLEDETASAEARRTAEDLIWEGNVQLLEHEQRALVQPNLDRLSCAFARLFSIGSALSFEVRGVRHEASYFTSFYLYSLTRGIPQALHAHAWPRITRFDDRWRWIVTSIVPRFRTIRCRHALGRHQPAPHLRRSARLRVEPLRRPASTIDGRRVGSAHLPLTRLGLLTHWTPNGHQPRSGAQIRIHPKTILHNRRLFAPESPPLRNQEVGGSSPPIDVHFTRRYTLINEAAARRGIPSGAASPEGEAEVRSDHEVSVPSVVVGMPFRRLGLRAFSCARRLRRLIFEGEFGSLL